MRPDSFDDTPRNSPANSNLNVVVLFLSEYPAACCGDEHENRLKGSCIFDVWLN